jgi:hypothetical protein
MAIVDILGLSLPAIAGAVVGIYGIYWTITTYIQYRKLQHIKGPWLAAISPLWMFYYTFQGTLYLAVEDALKKYGKSSSGTDGERDRDLPDGQGHQCASPPIT